MKKLRKSTKFTTFLKLLPIIPLAVMMVVGLGLLFDAEYLEIVVPIAGISIFVSLCLSVSMLYIEGQWFCRRKVINECKDIFDEKVRNYKASNFFPDDKYNVLLSFNGEPAVRARHVRYQYVVMIFKENRFKFLILDRNNQKKVIKEFDLGIWDLKGLLFYKKGKVEMIKLYLPAYYTQNVANQKWNLYPLRFKRRNLQAFMHYFDDNDDAFDNLANKIERTFYKSNQK